MNNPLFSILIANYNNGKYFTDCYNSILSQSYQNWEAIIVDDCSTDDSVEQIKNIIGDDKRFRIYKNEQNSGVGFTKKRCAELATGEICGFVDPDDSLTPDAIEIMIEQHLKYPEIAMVYSNYIFHDVDMNFIKVQKNSPIPNGDPFFFNLDFVINHFATFKMATYVKTEGINTYMKRAVDMDLYFKLYEYGDFIYINKNLYNYRIHKEGISTFDNSEKAYYWHWFAINSAAQRRNIVVEDLFINKFIRRTEYEQLSYMISILKKSRWIKLGQKLGFLKWLKK